ncbi:hypothetical protein BHM03_00001168 [Ensete ventricosum]|nr:hypothetical protein BHM03_00001168 [Ensete ventricosum]
MDPPSSAKMLVTNLVLAVDVVCLRVCRVSIVGSGPCALARPRSSRCGVGAGSDGWKPGVRLWWSVVGVVELGSFYSECVGHSYLISLLSLLLTMSSYLSITPVVLTVRRAPAGEGCRPYLCYVGCTTTDAPIPTPDRLPTSTTSYPRVRGRDDQVNICHIKC